MLSLYYVNFNPKRRNKQTRTKNNSFLLVFFNVLCQHILDKGPFIYAKISMLWRLYIYWYFEDLNILQIVYICWELSLKIFSCSWFWSDSLLDSLFILPGFYPSISYGFLVCDLYNVLFTRLFNQLCELDIIHIPLKALSDQVCIRYVWNFENWKCWKTHYRNAIKNKPPLNQKKRWFQGYRCESDIVIFEGANRRSVPLNHLNVDQEKKNIYFEEYVWKEWI